ncbi:hypothetical protein HDV04_000050 [Boothiomyces sp. JEL0838]|nr:hypothetical protein HDV04_000050 [Boothiomyces sp. JEL0838]
MFLSGVSKVCIWQIYHDLISLYFTLPKDTISLNISNDLEKMKLKGYDKYMAFFNFYQKCFNNKVYRDMIFNDINSTETNWQKVVNRCLSLVDDLSLNIELDLKEKKPEKALPKIVEKKELIEQRGIYKRKNTLVQDAMKYLVEQEPELEQLPVQLAAPAEGPTVPSVFLPEKKDEEVPKAVVKKQQKSPDFLDAVSDMVNILPLGKHITADTIERETKLMFKDLQLLTWSTQGFSSLISALIKLCNSVDQDKYAQVHQSIPKILKSLLHLHTMTEKYIQSKKKSTKPVTNDIDLDFLPPALVKRKKTGWCVIHQSACAIRLLENSIYQIIRNFYQDIGRMEIDDEVVDKLELFMDMRQ